MGEQRCRPREGVASGKDGAMALQWPDTAMPRPGLAYRLPTMEAGGSAMAAADGGSHVLSSGLGHRHERGVLEWDGARRRGMGVA